MSHITQRLVPELEALPAALIIFDKGGTLIDFHGMWSDWVTELARRLESVTDFPVTDRLFHALGFDPISRQLDPHGRIVTAPMADLRALTVDLLREAGLSHQASEAVMAATWYAPDPVREARPLADLGWLFERLRENGLRITIATVDDRAPTEATLAALGIAPFVETLICADDGLPIKPAPDAVQAVCQITGVAPARAVVVGDRVADMQMGRAAGTGLVIGVLSGVSSREALAPHADLVLESVAELIAV